MTASPFLLLRPPRHQLEESPSRPDSLLQQHPNISISRDQITPRSFVQSIWSYLDLCFSSSRRARARMCGADKSATKWTGSRLAPHVSDSLCAKEFPRLLITIRVLLLESCEGNCNRVVTILTALGLRYHHRLINRWKIRVTLPQRIRC